MHGQGYVPPPPPRRPSTAVLVVLRVLFVALPLLSIGFLAWVSTLWAAIVTRKPRDWWAFAASVAVLVVSFSLLATDDTDDFSSPKGNAGMIILLLNACACAGYFLYTDVRHYQSPYHPRPVASRPPVAGYGHPQPAYPYAATPPQPPAAAYQVPQPLHPVQPPPHRQPPPPARIDQVRAELDELSDYLRRHDGQGNGNHEGGR
ncbi:hypothetical protein [Streptomyces lancefieldiae]|uniref:Integral membrane protein n=1 Tax=Streptomyces lancefieldiae TaxID=3075520 RepID=A0ABU3AIE2_9ACTN|nr:hypothetical protein [Streptomyces sp. DSM 40712]MDT0609956.1 hypothetical protein [Streptomyces sp. DSM 40712]